MWRISWNFLIKFIAFLYLKKNCHFKTFADDFGSLTGHDLPFEYDENLEIYLKHVDGVFPVLQPQGTQFWYFQEKPVEPTTISIALEQPKVSETLPITSKKRSLDNVGVRYEYYLGDQGSSSDFPLGNTQHIRVKRFGANRDVQGVTERVSLVFLNQCFY